MPWKTIQNITGIGKYEGGRNSFRRFFPQMYHLQVQCPKLFAQQEPLQLFSGNVFGCHTVQSCKTMQNWTQKARELPHQTLSGGKWGWKQRRGKRTNKKKKKKICIFLTITDGFLILQHLYGDSTILIPLQAQYFLLLATLLRRGKQSCMPTLRAGKTLCCPIHQKLPHPLLFFPFCFDVCFSVVVLIEKEYKRHGGEGVGKATYQNSWFAGINWGNKSEK